MKKSKLFLLAIIVSCFSSAALSSESDIYKKIDLFGEVLEKINEEYVDEINQSESMDSAINGLLQSLDPYSAYLSPDNFQEMQTEKSNESSTESRKESQSEVTGQGRDDASGFVASQKARKLVESAVDSMKGLLNDWS